MDNTKIAKRVKSWIIKVLKSGNKVPKKVVVEEEVVVSWDELPPDIRAEFLRHEKSQIETNVTKSHDR
ncbi:MAG: hypothetical protein F6K17_35000 [Okeania sp. SIO3C4]|nr:hypothetical protein [Okeania sp. SIO3B3]NER07406.1 hypothetical protein [Okeania sp. SIO3C4]